MRERGLHFLVGAVGSLRRRRGRVGRGRRSPADPPSPSTSIAGSAVEETLPRMTARRAALIGPDGSGHPVKMVHNGIEYSDMQPSVRSTS